MPSTTDEVGRLAVCQDAREQTSAGPSGARFVEWRRLFDMPSAAFESVRRRRG